MFSGHMERTAFKVGDSVRWVDNSDTLSVGIVEWKGEIKEIKGGIATIHGVKSKIKNGLWQERKEQDVFLGGLRPDNGNEKNGKNGSDSK